MHVFHTAGVPPSCGRIILPIIGCTRKRSVALTKSVRLKYTSNGHLRTDGKRQLAIVWNTLWKWKLRERRKKLNHRGTEDTEKRHVRVKYTMYVLHGSMGSSLPSIPIGFLCVLCASV